LNPWLGILIVLSIMASAFVGLRLLEKYAAPHPEVLRKLMHILMGLVSVSFPWLFDRVWPVLVLAGGSLAALILVRSGVSITRSLRSVLHGVERTSWGELLFPVSVAIVFTLAKGDPLLYCVPILILALADAIAALAGIFYGVLRFKTLEGSKSIEGSIAFFLVTFICVYLSVSLFSDTGEKEAVLMGLLMGVLVMMFEAMAWRGLDNLFIPVASFALLQSYLAMDGMALLSRLIVILLLWLFLLVWRRRSTLDDSALIGAALIAYMAWAVGDLYWLLAPVAVFVIATLLTRRADFAGRRKVHTIYALLGITGPGLVWLTLHRSLDSNDLLFAYTVAFATQMTMLGVSRAHQRLPHLPVFRLAPAILQGYLVLILPFLLKWGLDVRLVAVTAVGALSLVSAGLLFWRLQPALAEGLGSPARWRLQATIAGGLSVLSLLAISLMEKGGLLG
jgi:phytol kinase